MNFRKYLIDLNDKQKLVKGSVESFELFMNYINTMPVDIKTSANVGAWIMGRKTNGHTISNKEAAKLFMKELDKYQNLCRKKRKNVIQLLRSYSLLKAQLKATTDEKEKTRIKKKLRRIKRLVEQLPEEQQKIVCLKYFNNMRAESIAAYLGIKRNKVYSMLNDARDVMVDYYMFKEKGDEQNGN